MLQTFGMIVAAAYLSYRRDHPQTRSSRLPQTPQHLWPSLWSDSLDKKRISAYPEDQGHLPLPHDSLWHPVANRFAYKLTENMSCWFDSPADLLHTNSRVHVANEGPKKNGFSQGCVIAPIFLSQYANNLMATNSRKFIWADDICLDTGDTHLSKIVQARLACCHWLQINAPLSPPVD